MLHIATLLGIASRLLLDQRLVVVFRSQARMALHLSLAFGIAAGMYGLILLAITETYPPSGSMAPMLYGIGLAVAALLAICGGTLAAPDRLATVTCRGASTLAFLLPLGLYVQMAVGGEPHAGSLWYLAGGVAGSIGAMRLMPWLREMPGMSRV
jgi:hypothetical protein